MIGKNKNPNTMDGFDGNDKTVLLNDGGKTEPFDGNDKTVLLFQSANTEAPDGGDKTVLLSESANTAPHPENVNPNVPPESMENIFGSTYTILEKIGEGSGGVVYKALHTRLNKEVVIKQIINPNATLNRNETDLLKGLKHSYIPQVLDFIEKDGSAYTVMDFISGSDIEKLVKSGKKFASKEIVRIAVQLCEAVNYLHSQKPPIVHSDIKPANVMLAANGDICLIDFNVSLIFDKNVKTIGGTPGYAPPEQLGIPLSDVKSGINGALPVGKTTPFVNERSDVYSIGAFLYFLIAREVPAVNYKCKPITDFKAGLPDGLLHIITKAMMLSPAKRYKNAGEMLDALKNIGKLDHRYKAMKARRAIATLLAVVLMAASIELNRAGSRKLAEEHEEKYQGYVSQMTEMIAEEDYDGAEEIISTAEKFEPTRIEPYYNKQKILYSTKEYEKCMAYPDSVVTAEVRNNELNALDYIAEMYEMAADSAFELENFEKAAVLYEKTLNYSDKSVDCYRDMTISYARLGQIDKAESSLETARTKNISSDKLELMQGEISAAKGDVKAAYNSFVKALELTEDDYIRFRAILICDKTMIADSQNSRENAEKMTVLLKEQLGRVSSEYTDIVTEMLANEYARAEQFDKAAETYESLMSNGKLSYSLQKNYFNLLYSKMQNYQRCLTLLESMKSANPDDYWVYMNESFVGISVENAKTDQTKRDYSAAYKSFKSAEEKYKTYALNGKTDANMDNLRAAIKELRSYGWITED